MKRLTDLPYINTPTGNDIFYIVDIEQNISGYTTRQDILRDAIDTVDIKDGAITAAKLASGATNRPIAAAYHDGSASPYTGRIKYTTETVDSHNALAHTTGLYTCPLAGLYYISYTGFTDVGAANGSLHIKKNGTSITRNYASSSGAHYNPVAVQTIVPCIVDDTLEIFADMLMHGNNNSQLSIIFMGTV